MAIESLASLAQIAAGFAISVALGFGAAFWLLPARLRRNALLVAPGAGYALFCLATVAISVNLRLPANTAVWIAFVLLAAVSATALSAAVRRRELAAIWHDARPAAAATLLMLAMVFWPVIYQGTSLYLGTANIDFYQSLSYQEVMARFGLGALDPRPAIDYSLDPFFGTFPDPIPAKFGGVMFGLLLQKLLHVAPRTGLMTALVVFLLALPAATCLFVKTALDMGERVAGISAGLIAVSAPVAMSFIHVLVGQNSSLALLPLALAACFLAVRTRDWRAMLLAFLLLDAIFWMYVAMLPYVAAPVGLYALYDLVRNRKGAGRWLATAAAILAGGFVLLQLGMARETRQLVDDMVALFGHANRTVYVDFLTEISLPHSIGLSSYPITSSALLARVPTADYLTVAAGFVIAAMLVLAFYFRSFVAWARRTAAEPRAFGIAILGVYLAVWLNFSFVALYGYAIFKMAAWLQFFFVPFIAYGLATFLSERARGGALRALDAFAAVMLGGIAVVANVVATTEFGIKGLGDDTRRGAIVNSYGIGGNRDYAALETQLPRALPPRAVLGIAMPDFIANLWASYYVERGGLKAALVSHDDFPDEDAVLPDVATGRVVNSAGQVLVYKPKYHADNPPYLLLEGPENLNREIIDQRPQAPALWSNGTFKVVETARMHDLLVTARGFYRLEYFDRARYAWWWPDRMRWTAEGGELLLVNASRPGTPHRLTFLVAAGQDRDRARHLDIYFNGSKFDEVTVHGAARVVTRPFMPTGGTDKLVVKVREKVEIAPRNFGLWNRQIAIDQRHLNLLMAQAAVFSGDTPAMLAPPARIDGRGLIDAAAAFDGISLDAWIAPGASAELALKQPATRVAFGLLVPSWAGLRFPLTVRASVNGVTVEKVFQEPGEHELEVRVPAATRLALGFGASQSAQLPGIGQASFRLLSLSVE